MDYAIASHTAAPWVTGVAVGNALQMLSDHCPQTLSLALPAPLATQISALPTLQAHWELVHKHIFRHTSALHYS